MMLGAGETLVPPEAVALIYRGAEVVSGACDATDMPYCECCKNPNAIFQAPKVPDGLPARSTTLCGVCMRHWGDSPRLVKQRDIDHHGIWQDELEQLKEHHADEVEELQAIITDLRNEVRRKQELLDSRPTRIVEKNLDQETVDAALADQWRAYRARDWAFIRLCEVHVLHRDVGDGDCKCGKKISRCKEAGVVDGYRQLKTWEERELLRQRQGLSHKLPDDHPGVISHRWSSGVTEEEAEGFDNLW
ncbi:hypothetical protein [Actinomadura sp. 9N407]|uniref:hypothetical protein n=1 Tax=Actinomadura sp. 9N407 TaxID=3375154 RepID=UPI0037B684A9